MPQPALTVNEIFFSLQGESSHAGMPCLFVRLSHCNLRCTWCDTSYAFDAGREMSIEEIIEELHAHSCRLVEVTGGEPLAQEPCFALLTRLCDDGYEVLLETSGSIDISRVDSRVQRIIDLKCPASGMMDHNLWSNLDLIRPGDEIKFVIADRNDYQWARQIIEQYALLPRCPVLMSPVFDQLANVELAEWILADGLAVRYQLQLHKYIWDPSTRGV